MLASTPAESAGGGRGGRGGRRAGRAGAVRAAVRPSPPPGTSNKSPEFWRVLDADWL